MIGGAMTAESAFAAEPKVRGPMAADGNSERASTIVLYLQGKLSVTFRVVNSIARIQALETWDFLWERVPRRHFSYILSIVYPGQLAEKRVQCSQKPFLQSSLMSIRTGRMVVGDFSHIQSCVKTFLPSSENHPQNVPLPTPKMHHGAARHFSQPFTELGRNVFFVTL